MAYNFENKIAETDSDVKLYLDEGMHFEAWTMIIRHWTGDFDKLWEKLEQEFMKKSTKLTGEEIESLDIEFNYYRREHEAEETAKEWIIGGGKLTIPTKTLVEVY